MADAIKPDLSKVAAVREAGAPQNATEMFSFLGLANYYQWFVPSFAEVAQLLYQLADKGVSFEWTESCNQAFVKLKQVLT